MSDVVWIYKRTDGRYEWRRVNANGNIVQTSGGQGYTRRIDCERMAKKLNPDADVRRWFPP